MWVQGGAPPAAGVAVRTTPRATLVLAPNPSAWTFEGTNTWVLAEPGDDVCVVVDPGPDDDAHLEHVLQAADGRRVTEVWVTHQHHDHADLVPGLVARTGATVRAASLRLAGQSTRDGDQLRTGRLRGEVLATPGHTGDSLCFWLPAEASLLTGDTVLGRGSPVVRPRRLAEMLDTLRRLRRVVSVDGAVVLPGHGPAVTEPGTEIDRRLDARLRRIDQVASAMATGIHAPGALVDHLYPGLAPDLRRAAESSVEAAVTYVRDVASRSRPSPDRSR